APNSHHPSLHDALPIFFTEGILRLSADLCKCHGPGAVQYARGPRAPPAPRRPPPSCKLRPMKTIAIEEHFITPKLTRWRRSSRRSEEHTSELQSRAQTV